MDPDQAWHDLAEAVMGDDWDRAGELAEYLITWIARGGFPPRITGHCEFDALCVRETCRSIAAWEVA